MLFFLHLDARKTQSLLIFYLMHRPLFNLPSLDHTDTNSTSCVILVPRLVIPVGHTHAQVDAWFSTANRAHRASMTWGHELVHSHEELPGSLGGM
jgi:hypothetical protein